MGATVTLVAPDPTTSVDKPVGTAANPMVMVGSDGAGGTNAGLPPGRAGAASSVPTVLSNEDFAALSKIGTPQTSSDLTAFVVNYSTTGDKTLVAAVSGQTTRVHRLRLNVAAANTITIKDGATTLEVLNFTGAGFLTYDFASRPWYKTSANTALVLNVGSANQVNGVVEYLTSA